MAHGVNEVRDWVASLPDFEVLATTEGESKSRIVFTVPGMEYSESDVKHILSQVLERNSPFSIDVTEPARNVTRMDSSMNYAELDVTGRDHEVTIGGSEDFMSGVTPELRQQFGIDGRDSGTSAPDMPDDDRSIDSMSGSSQQMPDTGGGPQATAEIYSDGRVILNDSSNGEREMMTAAGIFFDTDGTVAEGYVDENLDLNERLIMQMVSSMEDTLRDMM